MTPHDLLQPLLELTLVCWSMLALTLAMRWVDRQSPTGWTAAIVEPAKVFMIAAWFFGLLFIIVKTAEVLGVLFG